MKILKKIAIIAALVLVSVLSITVVGPWYSNAETHETSIEQIDSEISKVMALTAGAAGASAVISLLPDDSCTPIADQLADFSKYFLIVLCALYLEKYMITILGFAIFTFIIPIACGSLAVYTVRKRDCYKKFAARLLVGALAIVLLIPVSTAVSGLIQNTYDNSIDETIAEAERITVSGSNTDADWFERFSQWISNAAVSVSDYVTGLLSRFIESLAVMLVTSCLIPILVVVAFVWLLKTLFSVQIPTLPVGTGVSDTLKQ